MLCCREGEGKGETTKEREARRKREVENARTFEECMADEVWFDD